MTEEERRRYALTYVTVALVLGTCDVRARVRSALWRVVVLLLAGGEHAAALRRPPLRPAAVARVPQKQGVYASARA